jgi:dethiobiotin synthetase
VARGFFITATDTGVGKTMISTLLITAFRKRGLRVGAMKPFETGCEERDGVLLPADGLLLRNAAGMREPIELVTPLRYRLPLAPLVAAKEEGRAVELGAVFTAYEQLAVEYEAMVVEGIGGVMVPLASEKEAGGSHPFFVADLIQALKLPTIVVASPSLGTINHTLLTVNYLLSRGITVAGVIISCGAPPDGSIAEQTNPGALEQLLPVPVIGLVHYFSNPAPDSLARIADECIDIPALLRMLG